MARRALVDHLNDAPGARIDEHHVVTRVDVAVRAESRTPCFGHRSKLDIRGERRADCHPRLKLVGTNLLFDDVVLDHRALLGRDHHGRAITGPAIKAMAVAANRMRFISVFLCVALPEGECRESQTVPGTENKPAREGCWNATSARLSAASAGTSSAKSSSSGRLSWLTSSCPQPEQTLDDARNVSMEGWKWYAALSFVVTLLVAFYSVMIWIAVARP